MFITHPIEPVWDENSTVLILGTMPSPKSREAGFYYMHPQNRFWPVIAAVTGGTLSYANGEGERAVEERRALILHAHFALWDVLAGCDITGADDASIRNAVPNDFSGILTGSHITRIYCTGRTAWKYYTKLCERTTHIPAVCLPSTSPANQGRWPLAKLIEAYGVLVE
ncbi:MAG TPA: DNA-deoxyinosine glycosylase [Treponema sp.]|nr:DNA-deoxyinosine glycosylase [Treponema sp.]